MCCLSVFIFSLLNRMDWHRFTVQPEVDMTLQWKYCLKEELPYWHGPRYRELSGSMFVCLISLLYLLRLHLFEFFKYKNALNSIIINYYYYYFLICSFSSLFFYFNTHTERPVPAAHVCSGWSRRVCEAPAAARGTGWWYHTGLPDRPSCCRPLWSLQSHKITAG